MAGSGDVGDVREMRRRLRHGDVDGVVIARGALGNLWLIRQASHHVATGELLPEPSFAERIALTRRHLDLLIEQYGERRALVVGRKYVAWTVKGCSRAARLRAMVQNLETRADLDALLAQALAAGPGPAGWFSQSSRAATAERRGAACTGEGAKLPRCQKRGRPWKTRDAPRGGQI